MTRADNNTTPPITPPTIAPILVFLEVVALFARPTWLETPEPGRPMTKMLNIDDEVKDRHEKINCAHI